MPKKKEIRVKETENVDTKRVFGLKWRPVMIFKTFAKLEDVLQRPRNRKSSLVFMSNALQGKRGDEDDDLTADSPSFIATLLPSGRKRIIPAPPLLRDLSE
ncbi:hypothetical protein TNCV_2735521 [Trichonephila clavipes]|nr:hypothetical protein TNCV_2735521 [Trichonephila clavipes]